ncbi:MAG: trypsin-like peptidase domain-containing protein [Acidobacteria bacterium]|nr:trypsin-like peptidase domain-containing protein [Acidobacteriota bacterium]
MTRRFTLVTLCLASTIAFLIGLIVAGSMTPSQAQSSSVTSASRARREPVIARVDEATPATFADIAARLNPAVVNIDSASREGDAGERRRPSYRHRMPGIDPFEGPLDPSDRPKRGAGSGFLIDPSGLILTNNHVIEDAERITVKLSDGRSIRADVVGADAPTDIAVLKIEAGSPLPVAPLGNSDRLRVGEWVCAIGNPLAYEHTVTVGVVSYIGRKLFDQSLDNYIQTDAAINFGNSGGPLINARGEVIGIASAISWRASNIGFAVPINQATIILPQLTTRGRVSRGYIGVTLTDLDPDLRQSLKIRSTHGALVLEVTPASPGERAGLKPYDLIVAVDGLEVDTNDRLIREISARPPGSTARLRLLRDGREQTILVKLAERPKPREEVRPAPASDRPSPSKQGQAGPSLGLTVTELTSDASRRFGLPRGLDGVVVSRVEPMTSAYDASIERGFVILEINRQPVSSVGDYRRIVSGMHPGDVLALYVYEPRAGRRSLRTVHLDTP